VGQRSANSLPPVTYITGNMPSIAKPLPPLEFLQELFYVSETSPSGLRWKNPRSKKIKSGDVAGSKNSNGYWNLNIKTDKVRYYKVHRIVFYLKTSQDPGIKYVDHINGVTDPLNLRLATHSENHYNRGNRSNSKSIYKGVCWDKTCCKWYARIFKDKKRIHLGYFNNEKDAASIYNKTAIKLFGEFARLNVID